MCESAALAYLYCLQVIPSSASGASHAHAGGTHGVSGRARAYPCVELNRYVHTRLYR